MLRKNKREKDGHQYYCRTCIKNIKESNKEKDPDYFKRYVANNREKVNTYQREYRFKKACSKVDECLNIEIDKAQQKRDKEKERRNTEEYKQKRRQYFKHKYQQDEQFRLKKQFESKFNRLFRDNDATFKSKDLIGCTIPEFKAYIEQKWLPQMTWNGYGIHWCFDKIVPFCDFDLSSEEQAKKCYHFSNTQPLFNQSKKIDGVEYIGNANKNRF